MPSTTFVLFRVYRVKTGMTLSGLENVAVWNSRAEERHSQERTTVLLNLKKREKTRRHSGKKRLTQLFIRLFRIISIVFQLFYHCHASIASLPVHCSVLFVYYRHICSFTAFSLKNNNMSAKKGVFSPDMNVFGTFSQLKLALSLLIVYCIN